ASDVDPQTRQQAIDKVVTQIFLKYPFRAAQ
ncbi:MAG TPA: DUF4136 domain-containing protein, partial [Cupriavidus sp.]|nr:DUF4136 domain-containing protein [Cupriavidus sp.]